MIYELKKWGKGPPLTWTKKIQSPMGNKKRVDDNGTKRVSMLLEQNECRRPLPNSDPQPPLDPSPKSWSNQNTIKPELNIVADLAC